MKKKIDLGRMELELKEGEKILITHKGSIRAIVVYVDEYDDLCTQNLTPLNDKKVKKK